ncbi:TIR domain-containing protein [Sphingomonas sp.]|uniref:TIR domain-containing protein n=1 Tax=Sphingomonas sp. TaxID=28214 RepID=UPI00286C10CD|nr:TIR domain-containing protein [Sphingomonas sp.]
MASESSQPTVFLSYAHDDRVKAQQLAAALGRVGYTVWWDALIEGGTVYTKSINEALDASDAVVVLWSKQSIESNWVRDEAAQGRDRRRLVPLSLDGSDPPLGFRQFQMIDVSGWRGRADAPQVDAIRRAIATAIGCEPPPRRVAAQPITRRGALVAGAAATLAGAGGFIAWEGGLFGSGGAKGASIAVLPFKNLSGDSGQAYLADGMTDEVRSALSRNDGLLVLAATSSNTVRDQIGDAKSIARTLGVAYLLEGSVQRAGDIVRVATTLTNGKSGFSEWSQRVDRPLGDIFAFESDVARIVSNALSVQMATDAPAPGGTRNVKAYEAYLRGKALYNAVGGEESDRQARANFELAIAADPSFALAHAALSRVLASLASSNAQASELKPLYTAAVAEAERAIELAPTLPQGQLALGYAKFAGFLDVRGARPSYDKAYRYGRGDADIVLLYAAYTARTRRFREARDAIDWALALDPFNPRTHRAAGIIAYTSRRYADAITQSQRALELNPKMSNANATVGDCLMALGKIAAARAAYVKEPSAMFRLRGLAALEYRVGNQPAADRALAQLISDVGDAAMYQQAEVMAQWGRADEAMVRLQRARAIGDSGLSMIATDPLLDPISRDPRYARLVRDLGFG